MRTDLVHAAGMQHDLHQAAVCPLGRHEVAHRRQLRARLLSASRGGHDAAAGTKSADHQPQRAVQEARGRGHYAMAEANVALQNTSRDKMQLRRIVAAIASGEQEHARCVAVQSVDEAVLRLHVAGNRALPGQVLLYPLLQRAALPSILLLLLCCGAPTPATAHRHRPARWLPECANVPLLRNRIRHFIDRAVKDFGSGWGQILRMEIVQLFATHRHCTQDCLEKMIVENACASQRLRQAEGIRRREVRYCP
mmetsp:Transcript_13055/g.29807  ORF Transcript_13055/g.29807 Transcript_13055/m.29807 type:complete len:252 (-) Transcript_13055:173-928(-)